MRHSATSIINIVANAFIEGLTPILTFENMRIGRVVAPGPDKKLAITRSSKDNVKDNNHPARIDLLIIGIVMNMKTFKGLAPKFKAASSNE